MAVGTYTYTAPISANRHDSNTRAGMQRHMGRNQWWWWWSSLCSACLLARARRTAEKQHEQHCRCMRCAPDPGSCRERNATHAMRRLPSALREFGSVPDSWHAFSILRRREQMSSGHHARVGGGGADRRATNPHALPVICTAPPSEDPPTP